MPYHDPLDFIEVSGTGIIYIYIVFVHFSSVCKRAAVGIHDAYNVKFLQMETEGVAMGPGFWFSIHFHKY